MSPGVINVLEEAGGAAPRAPRAEIEVSEGVRLLITQMLLAGNSPELMAERLGAEFGVSDPEEVVDEVVDASRPRPVSSRTRRLSG